MGSTTRRECLKRSKETVDRLLKHNIHHGIIRINHCRECRRILYFLAVLFFLSLARAQESEDILDTTTSRPVIVNLPDLGRIQGKRQSGVDFFGGIPYAAPPVGNKRWAAPEPPAPWAPAKLDATHFGADCWQLVDPLMNPAADAAQMSEDCLFLNVFTPAGHASRNSLLPVMVWLHGGAFQQGAGRRPEYNGRRLAERGTIVVTINYRLGALGFLVSSSDGIFGNFGLMDQRAALQWVKDNIRSFGGDPNNVMLFGESAGAVFTVLHLMMDGAGKLFHKAVIQSNPLGLQFRSVVVADFIGEALKHSVDCRDLACLRAERVEEIMRAQSTLMGIPRSVGDFFTWGPTMTQELKFTVGGRGLHGSSSLLSREHVMFRDLDSWKWQSNRDSSWAAVNVTQPLKNLNLIPDDIPVIIGANKHEGEMFVHGAFPISMSKPIYWMFVGALFRDSASRVLKHYRGYVDELENEAKASARLRVEEEKNKQYYLEHRFELDEEYERLLELNATRASITKKTNFEALVDAWRGGATQGNNTGKTSWHHKLIPFRRSQSSEESLERSRLRQERRILKAKENALKEAAKIVVDYRPVMSRIMDDYLFRCPAWHFAHSLSRNRYNRGQKNNVYVYQFSHSTHIPGYKECWGKACHTAELPYVFQAMDIIRSNYSTLGPFAQAEAPEAPQYPYTEMLAAYRVAMEAADRHLGEDALDDLSTGGQNNSSMSIDFQRILKSFFGDYFKEDADEEIASDMAERWVAFASAGNPNYEGQKAEWRPWRYVFDDDKAPMPWEPEDFDQIFELENEDMEEEIGIEGYQWSEDLEDRAVRRRALQAMSMGVIEEDVFQTMLIRTSKDADADNPFAFLFNKDGPLKKPWTKKGEEKMTRQAVRQLQQIAQDMGLLGTGLAGERRRGQSTNWEDDFFPEILELKWPPEGRLVERDCTCDLWNRIRYRY
jgi:carboxylesterase type B